MADQDRPGTDKSPSATPNRGIPRKAPLINARATDVTPTPESPAGAPASTEDIVAQTMAASALPGADTAAPAEPESVVNSEAPLPGDPIPPPANEPPAPAAPARIGRALPLAALAVSLLALLAAGALGWQNYMRPDPAAGLQTRLDALDKRIAAGESAAKAFAALDERVRGLEAATRTNAGALDAVRADTRKALDAATAAARSPTPAPAASPAVPVDLAPLEARIAEVESQVKANAQAAGRIEEVSRAVTAIDQRVAADTRRLDTIAAQPKLDVAATERKTQTAVAAADSAATVVVAQALVRAIESGRPFTDELAALAASGADKSRIAPLQAVAARGVPTARALADGFAPLAGPIIAGTDPAATGGIWDRLTRGAGKLVRIRPAGDSTGDDPASIVARMEAALARGDVASALAARDALPGPAKATSEAWAAQARTRVEALAAANAIVSDATQRLGRSRT